MERSWILRIKKTRTYEYLVHQAESYEVSEQQIMVPTTSTRTPLQTSTMRHNLDHNRLRNGRQEQKTGFNPSNNNLSNGPAKSHSRNNANWDTITTNLDQKTKIELIRGKKCLWYRNNADNCKDCRKRQAKQPIITTA